jgi:hypothetical protein
MVSEKIGGFFLGLDSFGATTGLQIMGGSKYNTYIGTFFTALSYSILLIYAYYMGNQLILF